MADPIIYPGNFDLTKPVATSSIEQGDDEIRQIKLSIKSTFPNITAPLQINPTFLNNLDSNVDVNFVAANDPANWLNFKQVVSLEYLPGNALNDFSILGLDTVATEAGKFYRETPQGPLGSILLTMLTSTEMTQLYGDSYLICDGTLIPTTSELYKFINPGISIYTPDLKTNSKTIRSAGGSRALGSALSTGLTALPAGTTIKTDSRSHNHINSSADYHTHSMLHYFDSMRSGGYTSEPWYSSLGSATAFDVPPYLYSYYSSNPVNSADGFIVDAALPMDTHNHVISFAFWSTPNTRSDEVRVNYFLRIN